MDKGFCGSGQLWGPGLCPRLPPPPAYHRGYDGLLGHSPVGHHGSPRPEESRENRVGTDRDRALLKAARTLLFQPWSLNLALRTLGKVSKTVDLSSHPDLRNQEARIPAQAK